MWSRMMKESGHSIQQLLLDAAWESLASSPPHSSRGELLDGGL